MFYYIYLMYKFSPFLLDYKLPEVGYLLNLSLDPA